MDTGLTHMHIHGDQRTFESRLRSTLCHVKILNVDPWNCFLSLSTRVTIFISLLPTRKSDPNIKALGSGKMNCTALHGDLIAHIRKQRELLLHLWLFLVVQLLHRRHRCHMNTATPANVCVSRVSVYYARRSSWVDNSWNSSASHLSVCDSGARISSEVVSSFHSPQWKEFAVSLWRKVHSSSLFVKSLM